MTFLKSTTARPGEYARTDLAALVPFVLKRERVRGEVDITLELTNPRRIQDLNRRFRGVDRNTDVIAFKYPQPGGFEGDIAINIPQARLQARKMRHSVKREIRLLLIHGVLHLLGYTDYEPRPRRRMFKRQNQLLRAWEKSGHPSRHSPRSLAPSHHGIGGRPPGSQWRTGNPTRSPARGRRG